MQSEFIAWHHSKAAIVALHPSSGRPDAYGLWQRLVIHLSGPKTQLPPWDPHLCFWSVFIQTSVILYKSEMICYLNWDLPAFSWSCLDKPLPLSIPPSSSSPFPYPSSSIFFLSLLSLPGDAQKANPEPCILTKHCATDQCPSLALALKIKVCQWR